MQLSIVNGSVEYNGEPVLSEINFSINDRKKIAIVGRNGCGKTTLLKAICGEVELVEGTGEQSFSFAKTGNPIIGGLKQIDDFDYDLTLEEKLLSVYSHLTKLEKDIQIALEKLNEDGNERNVKRYSALVEKFEILGGYTYKKEYKVAAKKFGFSNLDFQRKLRYYSGGEQTKISLLTALLSKPDLLLLDEPTNHLDIEAIEWLEKYLIDYKGACIIVSHDRMFLDKIVNTVYEIEYGEIKKYKGNYTDFTIQKQQDYDKALKDSTLKAKEISRLNALIERFRYKATKAKMAQAKIKQLERLGKADVPQGFNKRTFNANFQPFYESVENALTFNKVKIGYMERIFGTVDTIVKKGQKLGIIGKNGCGKSTLIKTIVDYNKPLSGKTKIGLHGMVGYFDQTAINNVRQTTVMEDFQWSFPHLTDYECRKALGAFNFTQDDVNKMTYHLSGGELVRLELCKIIKRQPNILVLDEPTNHLDIISKTSLEQGLKAYKGTVIVVSHDRFFIDQVCDRLLVFENDTINSYDCKYSEYLKIRPPKLDDQVETEVKETVKKEKPTTISKEKKKALHRIGVLEEKISQIDLEIEKVNNEIAKDPSIFFDYKKSDELMGKIHELEKHQQVFVEEWTKLMEFIENSDKWENE